MPDCDKFFQKCADYAEKRSFKSTLKLAEHEINVHDIRLSITQIMAMR